MKFWKRILEECIECCNQICIDTNLAKVNINARWVPPSSGYCGKAKGSSKISTVPPKCAKVISLTIFWCLWPAPVQDHKHFLVKQDFKKSMTVSF